MSSVQMVSATAAASRPVATRAGAAYRDADASVGANPGPAERAELAARTYDDTAARAVSLAQQSMQAAHDEARFAEWVERVRSATRATTRRKASFISRTWCFHFSHGLCNLNPWLLAAPPASRSA